MKKVLRLKKRHLIVLLLLVSICGFSQSRYISTTTKKIVFTRDGGVCQCCGSSENIEYDHIIPYSCGGSSDVSNIQLLCMKCNVLLGAFELQDVEILKYLKKYGKDYGSKI